MTVDTTPAKSLEERLLNGILDASTYKGGTPEECQLLLNSVLAWKAGDPIYEMVDLTPEMAQALLDVNVDNRPLKKHAINRMVRDMVSGRFATNGDSIKKDRDGNMTDGQNRCHAVIRSGATVRTAIAHNLERSTRKTLDIHTTRSLADVLGFEESQITKTDRTWVQSTVRGIMQFTGVRDPSQPEMVEFCEQHTERLKLAVDLSQKAGRSLGSRKLFGVAAWSLSQVSVEDTKVFLDTLATGEMLSSGNPILTLRNKILSGDMKVSHKADLVRNLALVFKSWNAWRTGKKVLSLRLGENETFPTPQ